MPLQDIIAKARPQAEKALEHFSYELAKIRTGQASPALVEDVAVDLSSSRMPLKQLAGISVPERNQILVQPWDKSYVAPIEKALQQAAVGAGPVVEGNAVRITLPPLTEEFRGRLEKLVAEKAEETREVIRRTRDESWSGVQDKTRKGELTEDEKFKGKEKLQKLVDEFNKKIEGAVERKLAEIKGSQ